MQGKRIKTSGFDDPELVQVGEINQFIYCPRRLYYIRLYDSIGESYELLEGKQKHRNMSRRGGWIREIYLKSKDIGLHGKIDVLEEGAKLTPIERKRAESGDYYQSDILQLTAYCMLLEHNVNESINIGYIYVDSTDRRHAVQITTKYRQQVKKVVKAIKKMTFNTIPPFIDNSTKCEKCSTRKYCMPKESRMLGETSD